MKKVAVSKQSSFDDPLFNPGDSFNVRDSDEYIAPVVSRTSAPELVNTLTASDEDSFLSTPKPMKTNKSKPTPIPSSVPVVVKEKEKTPQIVEKPKPTQKADPLKAVSVFENEGEDLFLPSSGGQKKKSEPNFEEELFGHSSSSPSELREVKLEEKNLRLGTHDSDRDHEIEDLGVGAIMEREELDFDMFGKSSVRQYEPMERDESKSGNVQKETNSAATATSSVRKDDLILESNDNILSDFESLLSDNNEMGTTKTKNSTVSSSTNTSTAISSDTVATNVVVDNSYDIDAYISQQEEGGGGGLFD